MALSRCLNKQFRSLFTVAILFLIKRVTKEKKSVPGTSRFWELTRRTTYSPSESQSAKQKTHHAPARFKTFSKAVHRMAVPHFSTFGVALNGFFEFWQEKKKKSTRFQNVTHRCHEQYDWQKYSMYLFVGFVHTLGRCRNRSPNPRLRLSCLGRRFSRTCSNGETSNNVQYGPYSQCKPTHNINIFTKDRLPECLQLEPYWKSHTTIYVPMKSLCVI